MPNVLIIEDNMVMARMLQNKINWAEGFHSEIALCAKEGLKILRKRGDEFFVVVLDLNLPDSPAGGVVDDVLEYAPVIVYTNFFDDDTRDFIESKPIIDYIVKRGEQSIKQVAELIVRLYKNLSITALVVDDSATARRAVTNILNLYMFNVLEASEGQEALNILKENPNISIIITDYMMPRVDGLELLATIRDELCINRAELAVVGVSGQVGDRFSAKFIKQGGNDFLIKPFLKEELIWRVLQNIEYLEHIETIRKLAERDYLTELYNRRYFFETAKNYYLNAQRDNISLTFVMIDIDHFKFINDTYGHATGDTVLKGMSDILRKSFRSSDLVARIGGEEFCVLAINMPARMVKELMERFRISIESMSFGSDSVSITVSIGVTSNLYGSLEEMVHKADDMLYEAKAQGRNRIVIDRD